MTAAIVPFPDARAFDRRVSELTPQIQKLFGLLECPIEDVPPDQRKLVEVLRAGLEQMASTKGSSHDPR